MNRYLVKYEGARRSDGSYAEARTFVEGWSRREAEKTFLKYHPDAWVQSVEPLGKEADGVDWAALILPLALLVLLYLFDKLV
jgi:hypothetical protein